MILLAFETCFKQASVAIFKEGNVFLKEERRENRQSDSIFELTQSALEDAKITLQDVDFLLTNKGPGSFTGVRIGLSFSSGLGFGLSELGIKSKFIDSFGICLADFKAINQDFFCIIHAMRGNFYIQKFNCKLEKKGEASFLPLNEINEILIKENLDFVGNLEGHLLVKKGLKEDTKVNAEGVLRAYLNFPQLFTEDAKPFYLRPAVGSV